MVYRRYFRKHVRGHNVPVGLVTMKPTDTPGQYRFGYSLCHKDDQFSYAAAREMAAKNIETECRVVNIHDPYSIQECLAALPDSLRKTAVEAISWHFRRDVFEMMDAVRVVNPTGCCKDLGTGENCCAV